MLYLQQIREIFAGFNEIKAAYLFGSYAAGQQNRRSDLDIGLLLDDGFDEMIKLDIYTELTRQGWDKFDLIILNKASIVLEYEVVKHNHLIYCRDDFDYGAYFSLVIRRFLDFKPYLEVQKKYLKKRIIEG